jgi:hypothetical protein
MEHFVARVMAGKICGRPLRLLGHVATLSALPSPTGYPRAHARTTWPAPSLWWAPPPYVHGIPRARANACRVFIGRRGGGRMRAGVSSAGSYVFAAHTYIRGHVCRSLYVPSDAGGSMRSCGHAYVPIGDCGPLLDMPYADMLRCAYDRSHRHHQSRPARHHRRL